MTRPVTLDTVPTYAYVHHMTETDPPLSVGEVARKLGVSVDTIRRWEAEGKISGTRTPGGQRRFAAVEVERVLAGRAA